MRLRASRRQDVSELTDRYGIKVFWCFREGTGVDDDFAAVRPRKNKVVGKFSGKNSEKIRPVIFDGFYLLRFVGIHQII